MEEKQITLNDHYKLGEILGRGGWGTVYKAWDMHSGTFVAVKEISLGQIPRELLNGIMSEITLLQSLDHPRIVRYVDSLKTSHALYIVLEYVENGSLEWIVKKFGNFPEHLIANYIQQVLEGLVYLHGQGVIHRDIKAANILTTKMGQIKLADFGVATKRGSTDSEESEPAGSPYWMAPEIIEMHGATTTSDIWSVGCTIIELVTGNPPYFELDAMPALFRIVQDDCPPIPDNISPMLRDFLMTCFQKEPLLRSSAEVLLKHRWLTMHTKKAKPDIPSAKPSIAVPQDQVQDYNKKLEAKREEMKKAAPSEASKPSKKMKLPKKAKPQLDSSSSSDDWDDDFDISDFKFPGASTAAAATDKPATAGTSEKGNTGGSSNSTATSTSTNASTTSQAKRAAATAAADEDDDWDDMAFDSPAPKATGKTSAPPTLEKPSTAKAPGGHKLQLSNKVKHNDEENWDDDLSPKTPASGTKSGTLRKGQTTAPKAVTPRKADGDDDNWDDLGSPSADSKLSGAPAASSGTGSASTTTLDLASKLASKLKSAWDSADKVEDDPFDMFDDDESGELDSFNMEEALEKDEVARFTSSAIRSIEGLNSFATEEAILAHCDKLLTVFKDYPNEKSSIIARTGVIPFVEMLQMPNPKIVHAILKIINMIVEDGTIRESFSVMGGIASTLQYANRKFSRPIRQETSVFIKQMLSAGRKTMQMFIGARGLPVLVDFIASEEDFTQNKDLFLIGIDCIYSILTSNLQVRIPKNDFCRLFAKLSLLPHLARAFELVSKDPTTKNVYPEKIADVFVIFSKGDVVVKTHFCEQDVLKRLFHVLGQPDLPAPTFLKILKCISALSMSSITLEPLSTAGTIKILVPYMGRREGKLMMETHQQLFSALYNLCRLNPGRQLVAAKAGIIPHLQWVVQENHSLKQFALPILFEMARSKKIRDIMKPKDGVTFFLGLLKQQYPWQVQAMDCLAIWLGDDTIVAETIKANLDPIIDVFKASTTDEVFSRLFELLHTMITQSEALNVALSSSSLLDTVIERTNHKNALVRVQLLKILTSFFVNHPKPSVMIERLQDVVTRLQSDSTILVRDMAKALSSKFKKASKGSTKSKESSRKLTSAVSSHSVQSSSISSTSTSSSSSTRETERKTSSSLHGTLGKSKDKEKEKEKEKSKK